MTESGRFLSAFETKNTKIACKEIFRDLPLRKIKIKQQVQ